MNSDNMYNGTYYGPDPVGPAGQMVMPDLTPERLSGGKVFLGVVLAILFSLTLVVLDVVWGLQNQFSDSGVAKMADSIDVYDALDSVLTEPPEDWIVGLVENVDTAKAKDFASCLDEESLRDAAESEYFRSFIRDKAVFIVGKLRAGEDRIKPVRTKEIIRLVKRCAEAIGIENKISDKNYSRMKTYLDSIRWDGKRTGLDSFMLDRDAGEEVGSALQTAEDCLTNPLMSPAALYVLLGAAGILLIAMFFVFFRFFADWGKAVGWALIGAGALLVIARIAAHFAFGALRSGVKELGFLRESLLGVLFVRVLWGGAALLAFGIALCVLCGALKSRRSRRYEKAYGYGGDYGNTVPGYGPYSGYGYDGGNGTYGGYTGNNGYAGNAGNNGYEGGGANPGYGGPSGNTVQIGDAVNGENGENGGYGPADTVR